MCCYLHLWPDWQNLQSTPSPLQCEDPIPWEQLDVFLGLPINAVLSTGIKEQLALKLEKFLTVTDQSPLSRQQKLECTKDVLAYPGSYP